MFGFVPTVSIGRLEPLQSPQTARIALAPLSAMLSLSLRRVLRRHPDLHDRLDAARNTVIRIAPAEYPVAFAIALTDTGGTVTAGWKHRWSVF
jgi:hypothetical protein